MDAVAHELARTPATPESRAQLARLREDPAGARELLADLIATAFDALVAPLWPRIEALLDPHLQGLHFAGGHSFVPGGVGDRPAAHRNRDTLARAPC